MQGAPVPLGVTGAEMNERGKPEAVWPARWMAPNKTKKETAHPPSTRARVPAETTEDRDGRKWIQRRRFSARLITKDTTRTNRRVQADRGRQETSKHTLTRRLPEPRTKGAIEKTVQPADADADKMRYHTRAEGRTVDNRYSLI